MIFFDIEKSQVDKSLVPEKSPQSSIKTVIEFIMTYIYLSPNSPPYPNALKNWLSSASSLFHFS